MMLIYPTGQNSVTLDDTIDSHLIIKETVDETLTTTIVPKDQLIFISKTDDILTIRCDGSDGYLTCTLREWTTQHVEGHDFSMITYETTDGLLTVTLLMTNPNPCLRDEDGNVMML